MARPNLKMQAERGENKNLMPRVIVTVADLGKLIREARRSKGMRIDELAPQCKLGQRYLMELEKGKLTAEIGKAFSILDFLGIELVAMAKGKRGESGDGV